MYWISRDEGTDTLEIAEQSGPRWVRKAPGSSGNVRSVPVRNVAAVRKVPCPANTASSVKGVEPRHQSWTSNLSCAALAGYVIRFPWSGIMPNQVVYLTIPLVPEASRRWVGVHSAMLWAWQPYSAR